MNAFELLHRFLEDSLRLPWMFKLFVLYGVGAAGWQWWKRRQQAELISESAAWPIYRARVVSAQVSDRKGGGRNGPSYWEGLLTYSYTLPGHDLEIGESRKRFEDEEEADEWARGLRDTQVDVRVDPADSKRSVWQETPVLTAPLPRVPELDGSRLQNMGPWGTRELSAAIVFCAAAAGAFFAAWVQVSCLIGKPAITAEGNAGLFFGMHIGAMACGFASGLIATRGRFSRSSWQKAFRGSSTGLGMKVLGAYTTVVFIYGWVRMAARDGDSGFLGILMFSSVWLMIYLAAAGATLQAMQHRGSDAS